ncbi:hypothetical protein CHX27_01730 [Flavobacterium aurantiibacter]|uniref:Uncharacterized protein n=1 Tax=Flavobacterium aurantiibacter TaxID=2023067 RepID=A0A256A7E3_9FLAO|nr:hypothetical protein CHX27_01730 [Flavobacterium aurantiibacter]
MLKNRPSRVIGFTIALVFIITFIAVSLLVNGKSDVAGPFFVAGSTITIFLFFYVAYILMLPRKGK